MTSQPGRPILAEDLLLLLMRPDSRPEEAGRPTLSPVLAGAVLTDLALGRHVRTLPGLGGSTRVEAVAERPPTDDILRSAWDHPLARPHGVQAALAIIGPTLYRPLLDRLIRRGDLRRPAGEAGPEAFEDGNSGRRGRLLSAVRDGLAADDTEPPPPIAALSGLLSGSGLLRRFDPQIPWTAPVIARARRLERGMWAARAVAETAGRSITAALVSNVIVAAAALPTTEPPG